MDRRECDRNFELLSQRIAWATLFVYDVKELTVGEPRVAFFSRGSGSDWQGQKAEPAAGRPRPGAG